jgi:hypothetical protein
MLPLLSTNELTPLMELRTNYPIAFNTDATEYFKSQMVDYIRKKLVFKVSIMGQTRGGKSETGASICFWYIDVFNQLMREGHFDNFFKDRITDFEKNELDFSIHYCCDNQQVYKQRLTQAYKEKTLRWGQIWQIDEEKASIGGVGSISELLEMQNIGNITALYNIAAIWIQPLKFEMNNVPFGIKIIKKDEINRVNWGLLFQMQSQPPASTSINFIGWVCIPLHENKTFREEYNKLKNLWVAKELSGRADERAIKRLSDAKLFYEKYKRFFARTVSGKRPLYGQAYILGLLNRAIVNGEVSVWNELEKDYLIQEARILADEDYEREKEAIIDDDEGDDSDSQE